MTKRLLVWDGSALPAIGRLPRGSWDVAVVGPPASLAVRRAHDGLDRLGTWSVVDLAPHAEAAQEEVAAFVARLIASLAERVEPRTFWLLETAEKSPFRTPLIERLYRLALVRRIRSGPVHAVLVDRRLAALVNGLPLPSPKFPIRAYWIRAARTAVSALRARAAIGHHPASAEHGGLGIASVFPDWWSLVPAPRERFFPHPPAGAHYAVWLNHPSARLPRDVDVGATSRRDVVPLHAWVTTRAVGDLFAWSRFRGALRAWRSLMTAHEFAGCDITDLIADDLAQSFGSTQFFAGTLLRSAVHGYVRDVRPERVLYRAEFQVMESALLQGIGGAVASVGYRHGVFGRTYVPMRFTPGALRGTSMPLPGAMLVTGPVAEDSLREQGYTGATAVCGPQRMPHLHERIRRPARRIERRSSILVGLGIVIHDADALAAALVSVARSRADLRFAIRTHPNDPIPRSVVVATYEEVGIADRIEISDGDLYDELERSSCVITIGSVLAFEALALGTPVVVFEHPGTFAVTSMREYDDAMFIARDADEMRAAIDDILSDGPGVARRRVEWPRTLRRVFGELDRPPEEQLTIALRTVSRG